jgi:ferredoxin-NADP reductase
MLQPFVNATVVDIKTVNPQVRRFFVNIDGEGDFAFKGGQFLTLDLPIAEQRNKRWRSYSIASVPGVGRTVELIISLQPHGLGTTYLFEQVQVGSVLSVRGPQGVFVAPSQVLPTTLLVCTGTGIAPFRSMLPQLLASGTEVHLIFGCRELQDTLYKTEMEQLATENKQFFYHPIYSRSQEPQVKKGYVHAVYKELLQYTAVTDVNVLLCGWKPMIDEARSHLADWGLPKQQLHFELYG